MRQAHKQIVEWAGVEPYVDLLFGIGLAKSGHLNEAIQLTDLIAPAAIRSKLAYSYKLEIAAAAKNHKDTLKYWRQYKRNFGIEIDLKRSGGFEEF